MSDTASLFLEIFNKLEKYLNQRVGATEYYGFRRLINRLSQESGIIETYKQDLIEYSELRNAIVHKSTGEVIADPHQATVDKLQKIYELLTNPPLVMSIAASPVYTCKTSDLLSDVLKEMTSRFYAYVPVLHDHRFVGVLSENSFAKWLAAHAVEEGLSPSQVTVGQLQEFYDRSDDKANAYDFVAQDTDVYRVREKFVSFTSEKRRLGALFVTSNGRREEAIIGIVTAWDLPKIGQDVARRM